MTCREKLAMEHPEELDSERLGGCKGCPQTYKYAKYGFTPCTETKVKLAKAIRKLQEDEITVPENMYDGVD